jgi:hypothetical protein
MADKKTIWKSDKYQNKLHSAYFIFALKKRRIICQENALLFNNLFD